MCPNFMEIPSPFIAGASAPVTAPSSALIRDTQAARVFATSPSGSAP
jgi:hypothetical protein